MSIGILAAIAYGLLALVGGFLGYQKAKSKISLISGGVSGFLLILGGTLALKGMRIGLMLSAVISALLVVVFAIRLAKTKKIMPAGLMIIAGITSVGMIVYQLGLI